MERALAEIESQPPGNDRELFRADALSVMANDELWASDLPQARRLAFEARAGPVGRRSGDRNRGGPDPGSDRHRRRPFRVRAQRRHAGGSRGPRRGLRSVGVTGFRNLGTLAARIMDRQAAEARPPGGPPVRGRDRAVPLPPGHVDDRGPPRLGGRPLGRGGRAARHGSSIGCTRGVIGSLDVIGLVAMGRNGPTRLAAGSRSRSRPGAGSARCSSS